MNGILYILVFITNGFTYTSIIYCLCTSALIVLSLIDLRTFEIPERINIFILILAIIKLLIYKQNIKEYIIGFFIVSILLLIIYLLTKGKGVGGGDVKLMAATGLLIGYKSIILAFVLGCILGSIIHLARMKLTNQENILAFGPYLSIGIYITMLYGNQLVNWYLTLILT